MIYSFSISTPANTAATAKKRTVLPLRRGIIHQIDVLFPPGPAGLLHLGINRAETQFFPYNADGDFSSDNDSFSFREHIPLLAAPYQLEAYTYNLDTVYDHLVIIRLGILPPEVVAPWLLPFTDRLRQLLGV